MDGNGNEHVSETGYNDHYARLMTFLCTSKKLRRCCEDTLKAPRLHAMNKDSRLIVVSDFSCRSDEDDPSGCKYRRLDDDNVQDKERFAR